MRKRAPILFAFLLVAIIGVVVWLVLRQKEPVYQGKRLTTWLQPNTELVTMPINMVHMVERRNRVNEAVRAIGTNAIPTLLRMLRAKDATFKLQLIRLAQKQHWVAIRPVPATERNHMGSTAFFALGHDADSALPALIDIYEQNISPESRRSTLMVIGNLGLPAKRIVPTLLLQTTDPNREVRHDAVWALAQMHCEPEQVVPALMKALHDSDYRIRVNAATGLGAFGPAAKQAIPALVESLKDKDPYFRDSATTALIAIDPQAAAQAGVKQAD